MAVNISWSPVAPEVENWSAESFTDEYHYYVQAKGEWWARVGYSIGRIPGTRNIAVRAVVYTRTATSQNLSVGGTPQLRLSSESSWIQGSWIGNNNWHSTTYKALGTQYATITGAASRALFDAGLASIGTFIQLTSPISGPTIFAKGEGSWSQGDETLAKGSGSWSPVDELSAKDAGAWASS